MLLGAGSKARVLRGGSWNNNPRNCRCANRNNNAPDNRNNSVGFRVVLHFVHRCPESPRLKDSASADRQSPDPVPARPCESAGEFSPYSRAGLVGMGPNAPRGIVLPRPLV
ncbi:MAG: SUMF1/EgtB/PvdO family nonheme iron enzyme [Phycisphaerae bacterium]|nr:SUMF1/EgtB/PvdO family nonheme iron enzyme [Phycisphaerae bacterium]